MRKMLFKKSVLFMNVFADEPDNTNFEEAIKKARQEEKDKLYPEIESLKEKLKNALADSEILKKEIATLKETITAKEEEVEKAKKEATETKTKSNKDRDQQVVALEKTIEDLNGKIDGITKNNDVELAKLKLEIFKKEQLLLAGDEIIPGLVTGNTEEEVLTSIASAKDEYKKVQDRIMSGVTISPPNPKISGGLLRDKTPEEIAKMSPKEYAEYRKSLFNR